ncbi:immunity 49 family protein, partial [Bacillus mobilis]
MQHITRHTVESRRIDHASKDVHKRAGDYWPELYYGPSLVSRLQELSRDMVDHVAARSVHDPGLGTGRALTHEVLLTAAEAAKGVLDCLVMPEGDLRIPLPLLGDDLTNMDCFNEDSIGFRPRVDLELTPAIWVEAFELCVVSGLVRERNRVIGPVLRHDHAPVVRTVTASAAGAHGTVAGLAQMDALGLYLTPLDRTMRYVSEAALCRPGAAERTEAIRALESAGELTPEQSLLCVLLREDRSVFERALAEHLELYRKAMSTLDEVAPRTLLPMGVIALVALAVQVYGWRVDVASDHLPEVLCAAPE